MPEVGFHSRLADKQHFTQLAVGHTPAASRLSSSYSMRGEHFLWALNLLNKTRGHCEVSNPVPCTLQPLHEQLRKTIGLNGVELTIGSEHLLRSSGGTEVANPCFLNCPSKAGARVYW